MSSLQSHVPANRASTRETFLRSDLQPGQRVVAQRGGGRLAAEDGQPAAAAAGRLFAHGEDGPGERAVVRQDAEVDNAHHHDLE